MHGEIIKRKNAFPYIVTPSLSTSSHDSPLRSPCELRLGQQLSHNLLIHNQFSPRCMLTLHSVHSSQKVKVAMWP